MPEKYDYAPSPLAVNILVAQYIKKEGHGSIEHFRRQGIDFSCKLAKQIKRPLGVFLATILSAERVEVYRFFGHPMER